MFRRRISNARKGSCPLTAGVVLYDGIDRTCCIPWVAIETSLKFSHSCQLDFTSLGQNWLYKASYSGTDWMIRAVDLQSGGPCLNSYRTFEESFCLFSHIAGGFPKLTTFRFRQTELNIESKNVLRSFSANESR